jgi:hypothetical protein
MKGEIKAASNLIVVFYFNRQDIQKISTSTKKWSILAGTGHPNTGHIFPVFEWYISLDCFV